MALKPAESSDARQLILSHALTSFAARGYDGVAMRDVAAAAGVTHGLIRYYFSTKEALWKSAVSFLFERQAEHMAVAPGERPRTPLERFEDFIRRYVAYSAAFPEHARIILQESVTSSPRFDWMMETYVRQNAAEIQPLFERLIRDGQLPDVPMDSLFFSVSGACQNIFTLQAQHRWLFGEELPASAARDHAEAVIRMFVRQPGADARG